MKKNEEYIDYIINKLDLIDDKQFKDNIYRLIYERNKFLEVSNIDFLTGTYNRRILDSIDKFSVVALCDINDFKSINDTYGHDVGDRVLKIVSKVLKDNCSEDDIVCRYGGDEFLVVFKKCSLDLVYEKMRNISNILNDYFKYSKINVSFSSGISCHDNGRNLNHCIKEADIVLYEAKSKYKSKVDFNNKSMYK